MMISFILCFLDGYNIALCNDELYLVKGGPASGSIILMNDDIRDIMLYFILQLTNTFRKYILKAGLEFVKCKGSNRAYVISRIDAAAERMTYLRQIKKFVLMILFSK